MDSIRTLGGFSVETKSPLGFLPGFDWLQCLGLPSLERIKRSDMIGIAQKAAGGADPASMLPRHHLG